MVRFWLSLFLIPAAAGQISFGPSREIADFISNPVEVQAVDLNGDGDPDILAAEDGTARVLWWENDGTGSFSNRREWLGEVGSVVLSLADHDGDARPDVWLVRSTGFPVSTHVLSIARGLPDGGFAPPFAVLETAGEGQSPFEIADVNDDGRLDAVAEGGVAIRQANGSFAPLPDIAPDEVQALSLLDDGDAGRWDTGDFKGSAAREIMVRDNNSLLFPTILADGSVGPPVVALALPENEAIRWLRTLPPAAGSTRNRLLIAVMDLLQEHVGAQLRLVDFPENAPPVVSASLTLPALGGGFEEIHGSQWDEVHQRLLITWGSAAERPDSRVAALSFPTGSIALEPLFSFTGYAAFPFIADLDGDEVGDLFLPLSFRGGYSGWNYDHLVGHRGTSTGSFETGARAINQPNFSVGLSHAGDVDDDGDGDLITVGGYPNGPSASDFNNQLVVWRNHAGNFTREVVAEDRDWIQVISAEDSNGDSLVDLLVQTFDFDIPEAGNQYGTQRFHRLLQQPGGGFQWTLLFQELQLFRDLIIADVDWDRDGRRDLVVQRFLSQEHAQVLYLPGTAGGYAAHRFIVASVPFLGLQALDMDRDGDPDFFGAGDLFGSDASYWMENDGSGQISSIRRLPLNVYPVIDLDGDGFVDFGGASGYYASRAGVTFEWIAPLDPSEGASLVASSRLDLDQDGDPDLVQMKAAFGDGNKIALGWLENRNGQVERSYVRPGGDPFDLRNRPIDGPRSAYRRETASVDIDGDGFPDLVVLANTGRMEWFKITPAAAPAAFTAWMAAGGLGGHSAGPLADWESDGIPNWTEFAFGSDPAVPDAGHPGLPRLVSTAQGLAFSFQRRTDALVSGLNYPLERSGDLVDWDHWTPEVQTTPAAAGYEKISVPVNPGAGKEFFRIDLTDPP